MQDSSMLDEVDRQLINEGRVSLRCDTAPALTGWPLVATFGARTPPDRLRATARAPGRPPEVRIRAAVTGADNLLMTVWTRSAADRRRPGASPAGRLPGPGLTGRVTLRPARRRGHPLDRDGRGAGAVPIDPRSG
jgi:hypothetical protein